jgi:hypothetical protein
VRLEYDDCEKIAAYVQRIRRRARARGMRERFNAQNMTPIERDFQAHLAEVAFARLVGLADWYPDPHAFGHGDVGRVQVRSSVHNWNSKLAVQLWDRPDRVYVLMTGETLWWKFRGWRWGHDCKVPKYWRTTRYVRESFGVPQSDLLPLEELPRDQLSTAS